MVEEVRAASMVGVAAFWERSLGLLAAHPAAVAKVVVEKVTGWMVVEGMSSAVSVGRRGAMVTMEVYPG